jgi:hypothetical protein
MGMKRALISIRTGTFFRDCMCADRFDGSRIFVAAWAYCRSK